MKTRWFVWAVAVSMAGCRSQNTSSLRTEAPESRTEMQQAYPQPAAPANYQQPYPVVSQTAFQEQPPMTPWWQTPATPQAVGPRYQPYAGTLSEDRDWELQRQAEIIRQQQEQLRQAAEEIERLRREQEEMRQDLRDAARAYDRLTQESERYRKGFTSRTSVDYAERDFQRALDRAGNR